MTFWGVIATLVFFLGNLTPLAASPAKKLAEWNQLFEASSQASEAEDYQTALSKAKMALNFATKNFGNSAKPTALSNWHLASLYSDLEQDDKAKPLMQKAYKIAKKAFGKSSESYDILNSLAELNSLGGDITLAQKQYSQVYQFRKENLGLEDTSTLEALNSLAQMEEALGKLKTAGDLYQKALNTQKQIAEPDGDALLGSMEGLASIYKKQGSFTLAEELTEQILAVKVQAYGKEDYEYFSTLLSLGGIQLAKGNYERARDLILSAISGIATTEGAESPDLFLAKSSLGQAEEALGNYFAAEELYREVYKFDQKYYGEMDSNSIIDLNNLAGILRKKGEYEESEQRYTVAMQQIKEVLGADHPESLSIMNNLGLLFENRGFFDQAEPIMKEAYYKANSSLGPANPKTLAMANNLAGLYESQGVFNKSEVLYQKILATSESSFGLTDSRTTAFKNNLAYLYLMQENFAKAEPNFASVFKQWEQDLGLRHQKTLKSLNNLGRAQHGLKQFDAAEVTISQALKLRKEVLGIKHPDVVRSSIDLGSLLISKGDQIKAQHQLEGALALSEEVLGDKHQYTFDALNHLVRSQSAAGKNTKALLTAYKGFTRRNEFFNQVLWVAGENTRNGYISLHRHEQDRLLSLLMAEKHPVAAYLALEVSLKRKGLLLKIASETKKVIEMQADPVLTEMATKLEVSRKALADLTLKGPQGKSTEEFHAQVEAYEQTNNDLQAKLGQASIAFRDTIAVVSSDELVKALPADHALLDFMVYSTDGVEKVMAIVGVKSVKSCMGFFTCDDPTFTLVDLGDHKAIQDAVGYFRDSIMDDSIEPDELEEAGNDVYRLVWEPVYKKFGKLNRIYMIPDGIFNILPIDAIPDLAKGGYLLENYHIKILSSARDLVIPPPIKSKGEFVILAGPDYDTDYVPPTIKKAATSRSRSAVKDGIKLSPQGLRALAFDPLEGAKVEGQTILTVAQDKQARTDFTTGPKAEEQRLRDWKTPPRILHIATHGFFLKEEEKLKNRLLSISRGGAVKPPPPGDNPLLRAGLAFAGINSNAPLLGEIDSDNDGVLTAMEVLSLNLYGTEMVVLSACETGLGEIHAGEGVYGLRRAFQEAGVSNVVNSLWEVSDDATRDLMTGFYNRLLAGMDARDAMREAQLELLRSESWNHPYFWSAFQMVGRE
ncbi:MAG: CHAT domain-containing protein [SAR324 cluster bacterium]|nr:CHAT domain-containing protein [SAR324 cluster bacterium]